MLQELNKFTLQLCVPAMTNMAAGRIRCKIYTMVMCVKKKDASWLHGAFAQSCLEGIERGEVSWDWVLPKGVPFPAGVWEEGSQVCLGAAVWCPESGSMSSGVRCCYGQVKQVMLPVDVDQVVPYSVQHGESGLATSRLE